MKFTFPLILVMFFIVSLGTVACSDDDAASPVLLSASSQSSQSGQSSSAVSGSVQSGQSSSAISGSIQSGQSSSAVSGSSVSGGSSSSLASLPAGTKVETFETCTAVNSTSYVSGTFTGQYGQSWAYVNCASLASPLSGSKSLVFAKGKTPAGSITATLSSGIGQLSFKYSQAFSTAVNFRVKVNGTTIATITTGGSTATTAGPYAVNSVGAATLVIEQTGTGSGQLAIDDITWTDGAPPETDKPTVSIDSPTAGQTLTAYVASLSGTATDPGTGASGVKEVWVSLNSGTPAKASGTTSWTYTSGQLAAGAYTAAVWSIDNAGNYSVTNTRIFSLAWPTDTTKPECTITTPTSSTISGTASDNYSVKEVKVSLDQITWYTAAGTTSWSYTFSGMTSGNTYTIYAKAIDMALNEGTVVQASYTMTLPAWTVMVYLDAANNLEGPGVEDFNEMESGIKAAISGGNTAIQDNLNVIVLMDRMSGESSADGNWTDTRLFRIKPDSVMSTSASERLDDGVTTTAHHVMNLGEKNMGAPATLAWFINYCKTEYAAQHYMLVFWNHGGGARTTATRPQRAVCWDDDSGDDCLYTKEISDTLATYFGGANPKLDILGYDACLMGTVEEAYQMRDVANYMVGAMQSEQGDGWDYAYIFGQMTGSRVPQNLTPAAFGSLLVEAYKVQIEAVPSGDGQSLSCTDLSKVAAFKTAIDALAAAMKLENKKTDLETTRSKTFKYWDPTDTSADGIWVRQTYSYYDFGDFCNRIATDADGKSYSTALKNAATAVLNVYADAIVNAYGEACSSSATGNTESMYYGAGASVKRGLSLFFPYNTTDWTTGGSDASQGWYTSSTSSYGSGLSFLSDTADGTVNTWHELMDDWY